MNYFNRHILYSPLAGGVYGGDGSEGGEGSGGVDYGGGDGSGMDMGKDNQILTEQQEIDLIKKEIQKIKRRKKRRKKPLCPEGQICPEEEMENSELEKLDQRLLFLIKCKITSFTVSKKYEFLKPKGETRKIKIMGTSGCVFSLTIKDSSDCSILKEEIENVKIPENGIYEFDQDFPSIMTDEGASKSSEYYNILILPAADVEDFTYGIEPLYQYADPIITVTNTTSQTFDSGKTLSVSGSNIIMTGSALSQSRYITGNSESIYTLTITESATADGNFYVKNSSFNNSITTNTTIKKILSRGSETGLTSQSTLKPLTTRIDTTIEGGDSVPTGDLKKGMRAYAKIEKTKTVKASLDKDDNVLNYGKCNTPTDKIELSNANDLIAGMIVSGKGIIETEIKSIDCDNKIILSRKHVIKRDTELTFTREWRTSVSDVIGCSTEGNTSIIMDSAHDIPDGTEILFDDNTNLLQGRIAYTGSGTNTIVLTITLYPIRYGIKNVTYTLDLDNIITRKPNAYDQEISIKKNSSGFDVGILNRDADADRASKIGTVVRTASHGTVSAWDSSAKFFKYTPLAGYCGEDSFTFTTAISAESNFESSEEKTVRIIVK